MSPTTCPDCGVELNQSPDAKYCEQCAAPLSAPDTDADDDWLQPIREEREGVEEIAERDDRLGGLARVLIAFVDDEEPSEDDLADAGLLGTYYEIKEAYR